LLRQPILAQQGGVSLSHLRRRLGHKQNVAVKPMARKPSQSKTKASAPKKKGRPSLYTEELAEKICARLADGESLNSICTDEGMPAESTVRLWTLDINHPFSAKYAQAREIGYLKMADELLDIADDGTNDWVVREREDGSSTELVNQ